MQRPALVGAVGSVIGVLGAGTLFFLDPAVPDDRVSYPVTAGAFRFTELLWTLSHVLVLVGAVAFVRSGAAGRSRLAGGSAAAALAGFAIQVPAEFGFVFFANDHTDDPGPAMLSAAFGISSVLIGLGLIGLGIGTLRTRAWAGWQRYTPLVWGVWSIVFIPLTFGDLFFLGIVTWYAAGLLLWTAMLTATSAVRAVSATPEQRVP